MNKWTYERRKKNCNCEHRLSTSAFHRPNASRAIYQLNFNSILNSRRKISMERILTQRIACSSVCLFIVNYIHSVCAAHIWMLNWVPPHFVVRVTLGSNTQSLHISIALQIYNSPKVSLLTYGDGETHIYSIGNQRGNFLFRTKYILIDSILMTYTINWK